MLMMVDPIMTEDAALLHRFVEEGSNDAFTELVQRHLNLVYSAALRQTGDAHRAADVAQFVFAAAARNAASLSKHPVLPAWLYTATRNAAINQMRAEWRRKAREKEASAMEELTSQAAPTPDWGLIRPILDEAMHELPGPDREAVLLRFFEDRSYSEVAAALRLSEEAARKRVDRALDKLGTALGKRGFTSTAAALAGVLANEVSVAAPAGLAAAIATTAATGAGVSGALTLMSMSKMSVGILIAGMAATGVAIYEHRQLARSESALVKVTGEYEAQAKQAAEAKSFLAKTEAALQAAQRDLRLEAEKNRSGAVQPQASGAANANTDFEQFLWGLGKDPAFAPIWHRHQLRQINRRFGELLLTLRLPADQLAKLRQLLIDRDEAA